ncbi:hypothetical protein MMC16_000035 [Acarospora aff. strigata]|nr:hypothetical protein [Acarospora aff. strigata]
MDEAGTGTSHHHSQHQDDTAFTDNEATQPSLPYYDTFPAPFDNSRQHIRRPKSAVAKALVITFLLAWLVLAMVILNKASSTDWPWSRRQPHAGE